MADELRGPGIEDYYRQHLLQQEEVRRRLDAMSPRMSPGQRRVVNRDTLRMREEEQSAERRAERIDNYRSHTDPTHPHYMSREEKDEKRGVLGGLLQAFSKTGYSGGSSAAGWGRGVAAKNLGKALGAFGRDKIREDRREGKRDLLKIRQIGEPVSRPIDPLEELLKAQPLPRQQLIRQVDPTTQRLQDLLAGSPGVQLR